MVDVIDLDNGQPDDQLLLTAHAAITEACAHALRPPPAGAGTPLQYGDIADAPADPMDVTWPYRSAVAALLTRHHGYTVDADALFPSAGVSQALDLLCTLFARTGDIVLAEDPTYFCALQIFADHGLEVWPVASDEHGTRPENLEARLDEAETAGRRVALCYFIPTFQNPMGSTMPQKRRERLVALSSARQLLLVADEVYQLLALPAGGDTAEAPLPPPMCSFGGERVVSVSSFSKLVAPGLRVGWIEAPSLVMKTLHGCGVMFSGGSVSQFSSAVVASAITLGHVERLLAELKQVYAERLRATVAALRAALPEGCAFEAPSGGYFLWIRLPAGTSAKAVLDQPGVGIKAKAGHTCTPGKDRHHDCIRLCFTRCTVAQLEEGCARLGRAIASAQS